VGFQPTVPPLSHQWYAQTNHSPGLRPFAAETVPRTVSGTPLTPDIWLADLFTSKAVQQGGVIRRQAHDIERFAGMDRFMAEIRRRGYRVAENSGQIVIFCNRAPIRWLTAVEPAKPLS